MHESMRRLAYLAVRQSFPKDKYIVLSKVYHKFQQPNLDFKFLELINPTPNWSSHFVAIDKDPSCNPAFKVTNLWVKFISTGKKEDKVFDGRISIPGSWLRSILDDVSLYSNLALDDGTIITNSMSRVIFVASHKEGEKVYISNPTPTKELVKIKPEFYTAVWREKFKESILSGKKPKDERPIGPGTLLEKLSKCSEIDGVMPFSFDKKSKTASIWWRFDGKNSAQKYPYVFERGEYIELCKKINPRVLNTSAAICASDKVTDKKRMCFIELSPEDIESVYKDYTANKPEVHNQVTGKELAGRQVEWIQKNHPDFPIFPVYHWAWGKNLYYNCTERLN